MITAFIINEFFDGNVKDFFLIYMIGYLGFNIVLMYYPKWFKTYIQQNADIVIGTNIMTTSQYYKMIWTIFVVFEIIGIMFLYAIGNSVISISLYLLYIALVVMRMYIINELLKSIEGNRQ